MVFWEIIQYWRCRAGFIIMKGIALQQVTFPVRVMKALGVKQLLVTNAAGALNLNMKKGSLMLLDDHINLLPDNPLRGKHEPEFGDTLS